MQGDRLQPVSRTQNPRREALAVARWRKVVWLMLFVSMVAWAEQTLSVEFLEYLAEFETDDGEWVDPEELALMAAAGSDYEEEVQDDQ